MHGLWCVALGTPPILARPLARANGRAYVTVSLSLVQSLRGLCCERLQYDAALGPGNGTRGLSLVQRPRGLWCKRLQYERGPRPVYGCTCKMASPRAPRPDMGAHALPCLLKNWDWGGGSRTSEQMHATRKISINAVMEDHVLQRRRHARASLLYKPLPTATAC